MILAWLIIATVRILPVIYFARLLCGLTLGLSMGVAPMYLGEIASYKIRGVITIISVSMMKFGILLAYILGTYLSFIQLAYVSVIPPVTFFLISFWLPDSPYYLLKIGNPEKALQGLTRLRGGDYDVLPELNSMTVAVQNSEANKGSLRELFYKDGNRRAFIIILGLAAIQTLCGSQVMIGYSQKIFTDIGSKLEPSTATIIFGTVQLISAIFSAILVDFVGRRPLVLFAVIGTTLCNIVIGMYFYLVATNSPLAENISWLPVASIMCFIICYNIGLPSVNLAILGEIFPPNLKAYGGATYLITTAISSFSLMKVYQVVSLNLGNHFAFWGFAMFGIIFIPFIFFLLPETKGKSLETILSEFNIKDKQTTMDAVE